MVVKLIQSDSLETLEKEINEFLETTARLVTVRHGHILPSVDIKVVPGYTTYDNAGRTELRDPYFIAVIQY